ncbi:MAG: ABC transporter substrate-binding protein [Thermodesulfobacteriota bacterium]|jgi:branched-chain amino acid transport system substrate-binding protein
MKGKKVLGYVMALVLATSLISLMVSSQANAQAKEPIKIGVLGDLTSFLANVVKGANEGIKLAVDEVGSVGGRRIELIFEDDASSPDQTLDKARKLVERDHVALTIGPLNGGCAVAVAPYLDRMKSPNIQYVVQPDELAAMSKSMFLCSGTHRMNAYAAGMYAAQKLHYKTAVTFALDFAGTYGHINGFTEGFVENGGKIIEKRWVPPTATDFSAYILGLQKADVAAVLVFGNTTVPFYQQYAKVGKMPLIDVYSELDFPENRNPLGEIPAKLGVTCCESWAYDEPGSESQQFVSKYKEKFGVLPIHMALMGYDSAKIAISALERTKGDTSSDALIKALYQTDMNTIYGKRSFSKDRLGVSNPRIMKPKSKDGGFTMEVVERYKIKGELRGKEVVLTVIK